MSRPIRGLARQAAAAGLLGLLAWSPPLCARQELAEPLPAPITAARLVALASPADLTVQSGGGVLQLSVRGVRDDPLCQPERHLAWARRILPAGTALELGPPDAWGARTVRFEWYGRSVDWGFLLLRAGQAFPGGTPGQPARLPESYAWAAREARAEGRGLWGECGRALQRFRQMASRSGVPAEVLFAIAMSESGQAGQPWPWTLNVAGEARRFASRTEAWRALRRLAGQGIRRIDIGVMQIDWGFHAARFGTLWEALDPEVNLGVAAAILCSEWQRSGSLAAAIAHYHSADPQSGQHYLARVRGFVRQTQVDGLEGMLSRTAQPSREAAGGCEP